MCNGVKPLRALELPGVIQEPRVIRVKDGIADPVDKENAPTSRDSGLTPPLRTCPDPG